METEQAPVSRWRTGGNAELRGAMPAAADVAHPSNRSPAPHRRMVPGQLAPVKSPALSRYGTVPVTVLVYGTPVHEHCSIIIMTE